MATHENAASFDDRSPPSLRSFGLTIAVVLALIAFWPLVRHGLQPRYLLLSVSAVFLILTFVAPKLLSPLNVLWFKLGLVLHKVVNPVVLGFLFVVVLTPVACLARVFGKTFLATKFDSGAQSYWVKREPPGPDPQSIRDQF